MTKQELKWQQDQQNISDTNSGIAGYRGLGVEIAPVKNDPPDVILQKQQMAQAELDVYKGSQEYAETQRRRNREALQKALEMTFAVPGSVSDRPLSAVQVNPGADAREEQLKAQIQQYQTQYVMGKDMAQLESWDEADRAALDSYIIGRDQRDAFLINPLADSSFVPELPENARRLIAKYGQKQVDELAESLTRSRNEKLTEKTAEAARDGVNSGTGAAIGHNVASIPANAVGGLTGLMGYMQELGRRSGRYPTLDPNNAGNLLNVYGGNVRAQTAQNIAGDTYYNGQKVADGGKGRQLLSYGYQGLMGVADTYARMVLGGGSVGGATLAATNTFAQTMSEASAQGATPAQAVTLAVTKAGIEALSEKIPLDELVKTAKGGKMPWRDILKTALAQAGIEATTEEISLLGSVLAEGAILQEKSAYKDMTWEQLLQQMWETGIVSAISGGASSAGASLVGNITAADAQQSTQTGAGNDGGNVQQAMEETAAQLAQNAPRAESKQKTEAEQNIDRAYEMTVGGEKHSGVDNNMPREYNIHNENTGGNTYAGEQELSGTSEAGLPGRTGEGWIRGNDPEPVRVSGQASGGMETGAQMVPGAVQSESGAGNSAVQLRNAGELRISDALRDAQAARGTPVYAVKDTTGAPDSYASALTAGRSADTRNGWCVTLKSAQELLDGNVRTFMNDAGTVGVGVAPDGDIVAVFKNPSGGPRRAMDTMIPIAIEQGGDRLDCYGEGLVSVYERYGFVPVARVAFNPEYANEGWTPDKGEPYIYVMMHNGDSADRVVARMGQYGHMSPEQLSALPTFGKDDYDAAMAYRDSLFEGRKGKQDPESNGHFTESRTRGADTREPSTMGEQTGIKGTGAAERGFSGKAEYQDLLYEGNVQPDRPGDVRPMEVPKTDGYGRHVSEFAANAYGAGVTPDRMANEIESLIQEGALGFDHRTNRESLEAARDAIYGKDGKRGKGEAATVREITESVMSGKVKDGDIEKALLLYAVKAKRKSEYSQGEAAELVVDLATMANMTGRNLQMFKLLRRLTPQGQLMAVQRNVQRYVDSLNENRSNKQQADVEIPKELEAAFISAGTDADREAAMNDIYKCAAAQIKPTLGEMWDAWRNLAMLGNPKTHIRNAFGSAFFRPYVSVKRSVGAVLENMFLEQENRTKAVLGTSEEAKKLLQWAKEDAKTKSAMGAMEFSGTTGNEARNAIEDARKILPGVLDTLSKKNVALMEGTDMWLKQWEYAYSLASFLKARGYSSTDIQEGKVPDIVLQEGRQLAVKEALKATFNDRNKFSDAISKLRVKGSGGWSKALNAMAKGLLPYTRTPANILVRAKEYSIAEIARGLDTVTRKVKSGEATMAEGLDQLASGLTGSGAMLLGVALSAGLMPGVRLVGTIEDEDELREGAQEYSIQVGDTYYGISWLAPANMPLFIGANLYNSLASKEEVGDLDAWDFISGFVETCTDVIDPMLELSCLSSLADAVENASYEDSGGDMLLSMMATAATSYFTQGLPTIFGQMEQAAETTKSTVYSNADNPVQKGFERTVGNASKRIPGIDFYQTEKLDEFGNPVQNEDGFLRVWNAFINPSSVSRAKDDPLTLEISRLHDTQPEKVSPPQVTKTISYTDADGEKHTGHRLTEEEYHTLATVQGQTAEEILNRIIQGGTYAAMTEQQKASVFGYVYDYAREKGRSEALPGYEGLSGWMQGIQGKEADAILDKAIGAAFTDAFELLQDDPKQAVRDMEQAYGLLGDNPAELDAFAEAAGGRVKYFLQAKRAGMDAQTFSELYQQFRSIDQDPDMTTTEKAGQWSYKLEKAREAGTITAKQRDVLKKSMVYYQRFPAETVKFDQLTESGINADDAVNIGRIMAGIKPQEGYTNVRDVQKSSAIAGSGLSAAEKTAALKVYLPDAQDENLDLMLALGYGPEDYAAVYEIYANESGDGKKARIIRGIQEELGVDWATAKQIYDIYG